MSPDDRKYAVTHEWVKVEDGLAAIGITDHAQHALGDLTFLDLPAVGKRLAQSAICGAVESVKAASDLYAPIAGTIAEVNTALPAAPEIINQDPYGKGWILKLKDFDASQLDALLAAADYDAQCAH